MAQKINWKKLKGNTHYDAYYKKPVTIYISSATVKKQTWYAIKYRNENTGYMYTVGHKRFKSKSAALQLAKKYMEKH